MPHHGRGGGAVPRPLFDRFLQDDTATRLSARIGPEEYAESVRRDIDALLNTRSPLIPPDEGDTAADSVIGYGLPDFSHLCPDSADDMWRLASMLRTTLERFEPRLENIEIDQYDGVAGFRAVFHITADIRHGAGRIAFDFNAGLFMNKD